MADDEDVEKVALAHLAGHVVLGGLIFILIAVMAGCLQWVVHFLESLGVHEFVLTVLTYIEMFLFLIDVALFVLFLLRTSYKFIKELAR